MIPVVVVTGFLGSGKTTLLNRLLERRPRAYGESAAKIAFIVNEFGDVGIDSDLLPEEMTRQVELPGGCICCALDEDLEKTLLNLVATEPQLELVIVETTGLAEPLPIAWTLAREPLAHKVRLAAVITVVDALEHERHRALAQSVDPQVEYADILVVSKLDLTPNHEVPASLERSLRALNTAAPLVSGDPSDVADTLWGSIEDPSLGAPRSSEHEEQQRDPNHHGFHSVSLPIDDTLDFEELEAQLEELPPDYVRIKGVAHVVDASTGSSEPRTIAFHRVGARVSAEPLNRAAPGRIVALGPQVSREELAACIAASVLR
jgi:G3E family GTPase